MKYKITWIENSPTQKGTMRAFANLIDEDGKSYEKVTIWGTFPGFTNLRPEGEVLGTYEEKQNGQYLNKTLQPLTTAPQWAMKKPSGIKAAMEKKQEGIEKAQENRAEGVKIASTFRDATLITIESFRHQTIPPSDEFIQHEWLKWREWLWKNWDIKDTDLPPF